MPDEDSEVYFHGYFRSSLLGSRSVITFFSCPETARALTQPTQTQRPRKEETRDVGCWGEREEATGDQGQ